MSNKKQIRKYLACDLISALLSWTAFYYYFISIPLHDNAEYLQGLAVFTAFWILLYFLSGFYHDVYQRSRLKELGRSILITITGTVMIFLYLITMDIISDGYRSFLGSFLGLFYIHFLSSYIPRLLITSATVSAINKGRLGFNTIIIGSDRKAVEIFIEINNQIRSTGNKFIGFISINGKGGYPMDKYLNHLGSVDHLSEIISGQDVSEVILAIEPCEHDNIGGIIGMLDQRGLAVKAIPAMHEILTGRVRLNTIIETPLIRISYKLMPAWQKNLKKTLDIIISLSALVILLPLSLIIMLWIKLSSRGPVLYSHERIGKDGKPFMIYKFRTMVNNAETNGPELSSCNDVRVTKAGRFLRRTRLDELPNFLNVLKGDMSLVGPRPERRYYIDQIIEKAPHYNHLLKIKPGITSWGQVKFGYAENVDQMIQRLRYDIIYLQNMSVFVDFQIIILTVLTILNKDPHQRSMNLPQG